MKTQVLFPLFLALAATGCASIVSGTHQTVHVATTNNQSVQGTVDGVQFTAPADISVQRTNAPKVFLTSAPGCENSTSTPNTLNPWFWGNLIFGGLLGSTTDNVDGAVWSYQETVSINCGGSPKADGSAPAPAAKPAA